jgi:hypothetical protein
MTLQQRNLDFYAYVAANYPRYAPEYTFTDEGFAYYNPTVEPTDDGITYNDITFTVSGHDWSSAETLADIVTMQAYLDSQ